MGDKWEYGVERCCKIVVIGDFKLGKHPFFGVFLGGCTKTAKKWVKIGMKIWVKLGEKRGLKMG